MTLITTPEIATPEKPVTTKHFLSQRLAPHRDTRGLIPTRIALVGGGGNGSQMVTCLARTDRALRSLGLPPLAVTLYDPDTVSQSNVGRQLFYPSDVGQSKAVCLIHRANIGFGLDWRAVPALYAPTPNNARGDNGSIYDAYRAASVSTETDILITCVDTGAARNKIWEAFLDRADAPLYWLDIGNEDDTGQVWLGEFPRFAQDTDADRNGLIEGRQRLPCITEAFPGFFDGSVPETDTPTCSLAEALQSQDLFINDHCARWGAHLLWTLLRYAEIKHHGYWVNLRDGKVLPIDVPGNLTDVPPAARSFQEAA